MSAHPDPSDLSETDYQDYVKSRDEAFKDPSQKTSRTPGPTGRIPADEWPKCEKYFTSYAEAVGGRNKPVSAHCSSNVNLELKGVTSPSFPNAPLGDRILSCRRHTETARGEMTRGKEGIPTNDNCATPDPLRQGWDALESKLKEAEQICVSLETKAGVKYLGLGTKGSLDGSKTMPQFERIAGGAAPPRSAPSSSSRSPHR
jgi:hypothetical protein